MARETWPRGRMERVGFARLFIQIRCSIPLTERAAHEAAMGGDSAGGVLTAPARKWMQTRVCKISRSLTRPPRNPAPYVGHELNGVPITTDSSAKTAFS